MSNENYSYWLNEVSPDGNWFASFEDNGEVAYLYPGRMNKEVKGNKIHDDLWVYNMIYPPIEECKEVFILWSDDSTMAALIVDEECWGMYDLLNWRKLSAPRIGNKIETIPTEVWREGIQENESKSIKKPI